MKEEINMDSWRFDYISDNQRTNIKL